jgi:hypothetical protein
MEGADALARDIVTKAGAMKKVSATSNHNLTFYFLYPAMTVPCRIKR